MTFEEKCRQLCLPIHNFCYGTINSYYQPISEEFNDSYFLITSKYSKNRNKMFVYKSDKTDDVKHDILYSLFKPGNKKVEICHNLEELFDSSTYQRKKRYNTIIYPFNWAKRNDLIIKKIGEESFQQVLDLHEKWVKSKLSDTRTFQIMFPKKRYLKCFIDSFDNKNYLSYGAFLGDTLVSVRVLYIQFEWAFDLAFFTDYEIKSQLTNFVDVLILQDLKNIGIKFLNRGVELNKGLKQYKTQFPYFDVNFYEKKCEKTEWENQQLF